MASFPWHWNGTQIPHQAFHCRPLQPQGPSIIALSPLHLHLFPVPHADCLSPCLGLLTILIMNEALFYLRILALALPSLGMPLSSPSCYSVLCLDRPFLSPPDKGPPSITSPVSFLPSTVTLRAMYFMHLSTCLLFASPHQDASPWMAGLKCLLNPQAQQGPRCPVNEDVFVLRPTEF